MVGLLLLIIYHDMKLWYSTTITSPTVTLFSKNNHQQNYHIAKWHLFGVSNLPKTNLNLHLSGIFIDSDPQKSHIAISLANQQEKIYRQNDILPAGIKIYKILPDKVILQRNQQQEVLTLQKSKATKYSHHNRIYFPTYKGSKQ